MADKGEQTRERILAAAEPLVLKQGFAGTSLDDILKVTRLTKGAFFHHFKSKTDLARALVERYARNDYDLFAGFDRAAQAASDDPLQQTYAFLRQFEGFIAALGEPPAGCVFAAYTYESLQFDRSIHGFIGDSLRKWSDLYEARFEAVIAHYRPRRPVTARELADMIVAIIEGGFVLSRAYGDAHLIARQSKQFRQYLELLFEPAPAAAPRAPGRRAPRRLRPSPIRRPRRS